MSKRTRVKQTPAAPDREPKEASTLIGVRIKNSRYKLLQESLRDMVAKNPYLRGGFSEVDLIRALVDEFLVKQGKLKHEDIE